MIRTLAVASIAVLSLPARAQAPGSSKEAAFRDQLEAYYKDGEEAKSASDAGQDDKMLKLLLARTGVKDRLEKDGADFIGFNVPEIVDQFIREKIALKKKAGKQPYLSGILDLPPLKNLGVSVDWVDYVSKSVDRAIKGSKSAPEDMVRVAAIVSNLANGLHEKSDEKKPAFTETDKRRLADAFYKAYAAMSVQHLPRDYTLQSGLFLQYGAWLGDKKAFLKAKKLVEDYLKLKNPDDNHILNFSAAVLALQSFKADDYDLSLEVKGLLAQVKNAPTTPQTLKAKIKKLEAEDSGAAGPGSQAPRAGSATD